VLTRVEMVQGPWRSLNSGVPAVQVGRQAVVGVEQLMFATPCRIGAGVAMDHCGMGCKLSWARWMPANGRAAQ
jgi:hypothetical protein